MNEQFRKLLVQARELADEVFDYDGSDYAEIVQEKFAELIVKKCMVIAKNHTPDTEECENTWLIHDKIQKYFRVEE
jgi:hypothetical protein